MKRRKTVKGSQVSSSAYTDGTRRGRCMTARRTPHAASVVPWPGNRPTMIGTASGAGIVATGTAPVRNVSSYRGARMEPDANRIFVGIDPSSRNTGVVCLDGDGRLVAAVNGRDFFSPGKEAYDIRRHVAQASGIRDFLSAFSIAAIACEDYSFGSVHRAYTLAEFNGILKAGLLDVFGGIPIFVAPTVNKKFGTGDGRAGKESVMERAGKECPDLLKLPEKQLTSDVCDAWSLAKLAWYIVGPEQAAKVDFGSDLLRTRLEIAASVREKIRDI